MQKSSEKNIEICWINLVRRLTVSLSVDLD